MSSGRNRGVPTFVGALALLVVGASCGGSVQGSGGDAGATGDGSTLGPDARSGGNDATATGDAPSDATSFGDTGSGGGDAQLSGVPINHRPAGSVCPMQRGVGIACTGPADANHGGGCEEDCDCTMGTNGRCLGGGPAPIVSCSYDECFSDSDCPTGVPCACRASSSSANPNYCVSGSTCRVDSDCGPNGYCSPSEYMQWCGPSYHCHTAADTCINDSDCPANQSCDFDTAAGHWACGQGCGPPPP